MRTYRPQTKRAPASRVNSRTEHQETLRLAPKYLSLVSRMFQETDYDAYSQCDKCQPEKKRKAARQPARSSIRHGFADIDCPKCFADKRFV